MRNVLGVVFQHELHGHFAALRVNAFARKRIRGKRAHPTRGETTIRFEEIEHFVHICISGRDVRNKKILVVGHKQRHVLGHHSSHAMRRNEVAVENVHDDFLNAPSAWTDARIELRSAQTSRHAAEFVDAFEVRVDSAETSLHVRNVAEFGRATTTAFTCWRSVKEIQCWSAVLVSW